MDQWLKKISDFFIDLAKEALLAVLDVIKDVFFWCLEGVLHAVASLLEALPVPDFLANTNFGQILSPLPSFALYVVSQLHLDQAMAIIGAGVAFNLLRKLFTLGQW